MPIEPRPTESAFGAPRRNESLPCRAFGAPRLFTVPIGLNILQESVRALLGNRLIAGADMRDPAQLAETLIFVPSKRAARALRSAFVEVAEHKASFLPDIRPLGEMEADDFVRFAENFGQNTAADAEAALQQPALIGAVERQTLLARLIRPWREKLPNHIRALFGREVIEVPANTADALWLARNLADLMDEIETENADWQAIAALAPQDMAEWWQVTVEFLQLVFTAWPQIMAERGLISAAAAQSRRLRETAAALEQKARNAAAGALFAAHGQNGQLFSGGRPVLALGSTGSLPAAAELIKTIAYLPQGAVVLPGLDRDLETETWDSLDKDPFNPALFTHPQFALKKLLQRLNARREAVIVLGAPNPVQREREKWISEIFRPADSTEKWHNLAALAPMAAEAASAPAAYCADIALLEAPTMREEALSIAVAMRAALETKGETAALITGDRQLARRVCGELARFGIEANDSGGIPLGATEPAALIKLLLACIFTPGDAVALLALLKHPLTRLGFTRADLRRLAEEFEFFALRGGTGRINLGEAEDFIDERLQKLTDAEHISTDFITARMDEIKRLASALTAAAAPLYRFAALQSEVSLEQAVIATTEALENFGRDEQGSLMRLYAQEAGQKLIGFFRSVLANRSGLMFQPQEWPQILEALMADESVETRQNGHARLFILGLFEARLQNFDTVIIGGLNEGSLPAVPKNSPFMSRPMKAALGLPPPEQKIGFTAHDIAQLLGMKKVLLSRALRVENAPSIASRWLQRLEATVSADDLAQMRARGAAYLRLAQNLDKAAPQPYAARPCPKPPLSLRPDRFSITEIETLRRDPYALYARRILKLRALEPILRDEDVKTRGTLYHAIFAAFSHSDPQAHIGAAAAAHEKRLIAIAKDEFAKLQLPPDIEALWWPRFIALAPHYIAWEAGLSPRRRFAEIIAEPTAIDDTGAVLSGRADRVDILTEPGEDGAKTAEIIDFKTGPNPSKKQAFSLAAPQLALEGALAARGAFKDCGRAEAEKLFYVRLKANGETAAENISQTGRDSSAVSAADLSEKAWRQLARLIRRYRHLDTGYLSHALPPLGSYESDYDHLARVFEWSSGAGEQE